MANVTATYMRDDKSNPASPKFRGQDVVIDDAAAAPLAARQIVSISSQKGDPTAPHRVAAHIGPEINPVLAASFAAQTLAVVNGASAPLPNLTATLAEGDPVVISDPKYFKSQDTSVVTLTYNAGTKKVTAWGHKVGSATVIFEKDGVAVPLTVNVSAS